MYLMDIFFILLRHYAYFLKCIFIPAYWCETSYLAAGIVTPKYILLLLSHQQFYRICPRSKAQNRR
jgi:hypothetical protein